MYSAYDCIHIPNLNTCLSIITCSYSGKPGQPRRARASAYNYCVILGAHIYEEYPDVAKVPSSVWAAGLPPSAGLWFIGASGFKV